MTNRTLETKFRLDPFAFIRKQVQAVHTEKRRSKRVPYEALIQVAPYDTDQALSSLEFEEATTRDLSATGISFYYSGQPTTTQFVLKLGNVPEIQYVTAKVVRYQAGLYLQQQQFLIGCQFTGRIDIVQE